MINMINATTIEQTGGYEITPEARQPCKVCGKAIDDEHIKLATIHTEHSDVYLTWFVLCPACAKKHRDFISGLIGDYAK